MTRDPALVLSALGPIAGRLAVALLLATMLVAVLLSALLPLLSEPGLSPTRWYTFAT